MCAWLASSCATSTPPSDGATELPGELEFETSLDVTTTAWLAAETARFAFGGADPEPWHGHAPARRHTPDHYSVLIAAVPGDGNRVDMNGRLSPPRRPAADGAPDLRGCAFHPAKSTTIARGATVRIEIDVRTTATGSRVHAVRGSAGPRAAVLRQLRTSVALAEAVRAAADALTHHRPLAAASITGAALKQSRRDSTPLLARLRAEALLERAMALQAADRKVEARAALSHALAADGQLYAAQVWADRLDAHRLPAAARKSRLQMLTTLPGVATGRRAAQQLAGVRHEIERGTTASRARAETRAGSADDARTMLALAQSDNTPSNDELAALAEAHRARGDHRAAYETRLRQLELFGYQPEVVLGLHDESIALGQELTATRWLARYGTELQHTHPGELRRRLAASSPSARALAQRMVQTARRNDDAGAGARPPGWWPARPPR